MEKWQVRWLPVWSFLLYVAFGQLLLADNVWSAPCILQTDGTLNNTALSICKANGQFIDGVLYTSICAGLPATVCTDVRALSTGSRFCIMQFTGTCFCPIATTILRLFAPKSVPLTTDVLTRLALETKCLPEFYPSQPNCLGDQLCQNITATATQYPQQAKMLIISLQLYYPSMSCIRNLAHDSRFKWTADELMNLTRGLQSDDVRDILTIINSLKRNPPSSSDLSKMTSEVLLVQLPSVIRDALAAVTGSNKTSFLSQYTSDLQLAKTKVLSLLGSSLKDRSTLDQLMSDARRPSPTDNAVADVFRPLSNISAIDIKVMLSDSTLAGCYGDSELKEVSPDIICRPLSNGLDPFENLTAFQQRTIREHCYGVFSANVIMPPSLGARASPSEIAAECQSKTFETLKPYLEQFSIVESTLSVSQIPALQGCFDGVMTQQKYEGLDSKTIRSVRVAMRHVPTEWIQKNFKSQSDKDNYCQQMAAGPFMNELNEQKLNVLAFCLTQTQVSVCDLNDLLNQLSPSDVDRLPIDSLMSCVAVLARKVPDPATRRKILDIFLMKKGGWANLTGDDFKAIAGFVTEMTDGEVTSLKSNGNFGLAFAAIVKELFDQAVRVNMGEHGPAMLSLIDAAKRNVIPAVLAASQTATGSKPSRKKRATTWGTITCPSVIGPSSWPVEQLNNLSMSVFTSCPSALNVDGYVNEQVSAIAQLAVQAVGDPCMWNRTYVRQLGVIVFGVNVVNISCMDFNDTLTIASVGGKRTLRPLDASKYKAVFDRWSLQTMGAKAAQAPVMTSDMITTIGIVSCGMLSPRFTMTPAEYDKASKFIGGIDCYSTSILQKFASLAMGLYGNGSTINISSVSNIGTAIAGMDVSFFRDLSPEKVSAIIPGAIWLIPTNVISNLTIDQIRAFTPAQAIALSATQLQSLNGTVLLDIIMQKRMMSLNTTSTVSPSTAPPTGNSTAIPPKNAAGTYAPKTGTVQPNPSGSFGSGNGSVPSVNDTATDPKLNSNGSGASAPGNASYVSAPGNGSASGGSAPGNATGGSAPRNETGGSAPGNATGGSAPGNTTGGSAPLNATGGSAPRNETGGSAPGNATGGNATGNGSIGSPPASGSGGVAPDTGAGGKATGSGSGPEVSTTPQSGGTRASNGSDAGSVTHDGGAMASGRQSGATLPSGGDSRVTSEPSAADSSNAGASATPQPAGVGDSTSAPPPRGDASKLPPSQETPPPARPPTTPEIPAVINKDNILSYINLLGPNLSADELAKRLQPDALNNSNVLQTLAGQPLTDNQKQVLRNKIDQLFARPGTTFDPLLMASAGPLISPKSIQKITPQQILDVVKQTVFPQNRETALLYGPSVGKLLLGISNAADFNARMLDCQKAVSGIPAVDFMAAITNRPINNDTLVSFTNITFTERQARLLFAKFLSDNQAINVSKMASSSLLNLFVTLPPSLSPAIQPDSLKNLDGPTAVEVTPDVSSSHGFTQLIDPAASQGPLPLQKRLFEKVRTYGFEKLDDKQLINLMSSGLLTVESVKVIGTKICNLANLPSVEGFNLVFALKPPVVSAVYEICKPVLGAFCSGSTDSYGLLSIGATASDILAIKDENALFNYCIPDICQMVHLASTAQIEALLTLVKAHLDKKGDLGDQYSKIGCLLPYLGAKYLNQMNDYTKREAICGLIACQQCVNVPSPILKEAMDYCISNAVSIKTFACPAGRGRCLMEIMNKGYASHSNITCGAAAINTLDLLQEKVMDCALRAELYGCVKDHLNLTERNSLAQFGSLIDQFSDADWSSVPTKNLCGLLNLVSKVWAALDYFQIVRASQGLKPVASCTNRAAVLARLRAAEASPDCTGTPAKRRKRETTTLTCDQVNEMGPSVTQVSASELQTLNTKDFNNCAQLLGRVDGFTKDQWTALAGVAKQTYGAEVSKWTTEQIISAAGIVTGLSGDEISSLSLNDLTAIQAVGSNGLWSVDQLMKAFECIKKKYKNGNIVAFTSAELSSLSNIICGATVDEINSLQAKEVCGAVEDIGQLHTCEDPQLQALVNQEKVCLGSDVSKWLTSDIKASGILIAGFTKADISTLSQSQIQAISVSAIAEIPPIQFSGFTAAQLDYFSPYQAAVITSAQYQSLDQTQQSVIQKKLSYVSDDISLNPSASGKSVCSPLSASLLPLVTAPLAFLLRI